MQERTIEGSNQLRRIGYGTFPTHELAGPAGLVAHLGRDSSAWIFFGRGRRVRFPDMTEWRIKATTSGRHIVPFVKTDAGTVAISGPLYADRSYGINGKDYGYTLIPAGRSGIRQQQVWILQHHETEIATINAHERVIEAAQAIPVAAALLAFTLITHGIPGEANLMPG